jgi:hypothetical protein
VVVENFEKKSSAVSPAIKAWEGAAAAAYPIGGSGKSGGAGAIQDRGLVPATFCNADLPGITLQDWQHKNPNDPAPIPLAGRPPAEFGKQYDPKQPCITTPPSV